MLVARSTCSGKGMPSCPHTPSQKSTVTQSLLERSLGSTWGLGKAQARRCGGSEGSRLRTPSAPWGRDQNLKLELTQVRHPKDWVLPVLTGSLPVLPVTLEFQSGLPRVCATRATGNNLGLFTPV